VTTHDQLVDEAESRFKDTANEILSAAEWSVYLNTRYQEVNARSPLWPWLEGTSDTVTVLANTRSIALPADTLQVHNVYDLTHGYALTPLQGRIVQGHAYDLTAGAGTGAPETYRLRAGTIELYPMVDVNTSLRVEYVSAPAALATTGEPVWPEPFHRLLVNGMLSLAYGDDGNPKEAERFDKMFQMEVKSMMDFILAFRHEGHHEIVDDWYDD